MGYHVRKDGLGFDPTMMISSRFSLGDLIHSDTASRLGIDNMPSDNATFTNLTQLGSVLDEIWDKIGPFDIESGYRSPALQAALAGGGDTAEAAAQAATHSFHELGMAADITPTTIPAADFFAKLISSPLKDKLGEIALKTNSIHLSLPGLGKQGVVMKVTNNQYIRMTTDEIQNLVDQYGPYIATAGIGIGVAVIIGVGFFALAEILIKRRAATV